MALTINKLKMWKDPGYTRGCLEVPPAGSVKLPATADYALPAGETLRPHKGSILTSLQLPLSYTSLFDMSYLYIEATDGNATVKLYGWIDSITMLASSNENIMLNWSVDWWRSYSGSATFGAGLITRCADSTYMRPRSLQPRYKKKATETALFPTTASTTTTSEKAQMWVVVQTVMTATTGGDTVTRIMNFFWPALEKQTLTSPKIIFDPNSNNKYNTVSIRGCFNGYVDELLTEVMAKFENANPGTTYNYSIIAGYVTPIPPSEYVSWDNTNGYWSPSPLLIGTVVTNHLYGVFYITNYESVDISNGYSMTFTTFTPDDTAYYSITDFDNNPIGNLPWGIDITGVTIENDIGPVGGYLRLRFTSSILGSGDTAAGSLTGLQYTIPLPTIPLTSNYWSDYVLSGQREFNRLNREYAREEEAWKAGVSETKGAVDKLADLDILGAAVGAATGFSAIGANLIINEQFADKYNALDDMTASRQKNTIQENGFSINWLLHGYVNGGTSSYTTGPWLVKMEMDTVSAAEYSAEITNMGYEVQIPVASMSAFITTGGPFQARQAVITGNIPPQAKQAIKVMLENGIRIVENNPSGVAP